ncbi:3-phosphoshikimate 1-carboxyvinyltransferase [Candidatus Bathyarchaeota archaeon]|nr:3-phosphoshikimate 1-carboxyvinyltransferase [Candidatus Bathyarchaeota archaeon]
MSITIKPGTLTGSVTAPPSKSMTHRHLIASSLADGVSLLESPLRSEDTEATVEALRKLGATITDVGGDWEVTGGSLTPPSSVIDCHESGTTMRLLTGLCSLLDEPCTLSGAPSLLRRPNKPLLDTLEQLGVQTQSLDGYPPITVKGKMRGGKAMIPGDISSQFISSIILAAPYAENPVDLRITTRLESKPYVEMTLNAMRKSGVKVQHTENMDAFHVPTGRYKARTTRIEGDWSSAAFLLAAGALSGKIHVDNLDVESSQADREILRILDEMGAYIKISGNRVTTEKSMLTAIEADLSDCPDIFPIIACLCSAAEGESRLTGLARLRLKESDRVAAVMEGLGKMGAAVTSIDDILIIDGGALHGAVIDPYNDHRIAMSFAVLAQAATSETTIMNPECVSKSYPDFWDDLKQIGARIR